MKKIFLKSLMFASLVAVSMSTFQLSSLNGNNSTRLSSLLTFATVSAETTPTADIGYHYVTCPDGKSVLRCGGGSETCQAAWQDLCD
jgi:hypothetical protein